MQYAVVVLDSFEDQNAVFTRKGFTQEILDKCAVLSVFDSWRQADLYRRVVCNNSLCFTCGYAAGKLVLIGREELRNIQRQVLGGAN